MHDSLRCPTTKRRLALVEAPVGLHARAGVQGQATPSVLLRDDGQAAYAIVDGFPVLLAPEALRTEPWSCDLSDPRYAEAYSEMAPYTASCEALLEDLPRSEAYGVVQLVADLPESLRGNVAKTRDAWLDANFDSAALLDCYLHYGDVRGKRFLSVGGKGVHTIKMLLAGASEGWLVTPVLGEIRVGQALAEAFGVAERFFPVVGICEELPLADRSVDLVFAGGCLHHTQTDASLPEIARVLDTGGRFGACEPWRTPLYAAGTSIFGQRERNVFCRPITRARAKPMGVFAAATMVHHGALTRHPLLAMNKLGCRFSVNSVMRIGAVDDAVAGALPRFRNCFGSSVAMLGAK